MANSTSNIDAISVSQASKEVTANAFFDAASQAATYGRRASTSSGLTWGYYGGNVVKADGTTDQIANGTLTLTASATSYIVAAKATGSVSAATTTTNWDNATDYWRLYSVVAGAETVTSWSDLRAIGQYTGGGASVKTAIPIACSDEATPLTTGAAKVTFRMPFGFTLTGVRASVTTAPTGSVLTVDINEGGASILSTKLTIDDSEKTSVTAATPAVISDTALADDAEITIDIDTVGSTVAGAGLKVCLIGVVA